MNELRPVVFFYGSFMNRAVCATAGAELAASEVARLPGFDIRVGPLATLVRSDERCVYGLLARMSHAELGRLYAMPWVGSYLHEAVLVETTDGHLRPALVYIKHDMVAAAPTAEYVDRIVAPARFHGFPAWYVARLESFRPR